MAQNTCFCFHNYSFEIIITFALLFLPPNPPTYLSPPSFKITTWSFTNYSYMHICTYIYIPKYTLLSLYNITCMHVFIWSIGVFSSRKTASSIPSFPWLPIVSCVRLKLLAHPFGMSIGDILLQPSLGQTCWWDFRAAASDILWSHNLTANSMVLWLLQSFRPLFINVPWIFSSRMFYGCVHWNWAP